MAEMIYTVKRGDLKNPQTIAKTIIEDLNSQLRKYNIQKINPCKRDVLASYYFTKQYVEVSVLYDNGKPRLSILGDEKKIRRTKSKLLKIVGGLILE